MELECREVRYPSLYSFVNCVLGLEFVVARTTYSICLNECFYIVVILSYVGKCLQFAYAAGSCVPRLCAHPVYTL
jgi:hypothetical protein